MSRHNHPKTDAQVAAMHLQLAKSLRALPPAGFAALLEAWKPLQKVAGVYLDSEGQVVFSRLGAERESTRMARVSAILTQNGQEPVSGRWWSVLAHELGRIVRPSEYGMDGRYLFGGKDVQA